MHCPFPQFLDTMIQREPVQKAAFLRDLPAMCAQFDARILRYKVRAVLTGMLTGMLWALLAIRLTRSARPTTPFCTAPKTLQVLPPLLGELRDVQLQPTLLPIILRIVKDQPPGEFADVTLPALR